MAQVILVTGGAGFIGSALVRHIIQNSDDIVVNVDKLSYAGNIDAVGCVANNSRYNFEKVDIVNSEAMRSIFAKYKPTRVMHLAAESHVDRSITGPKAFIDTNIVGTYELLQAAREYWQGMQGESKDNFRFLHISTDEVFGSLQDEGYFTEETSYKPSSPYSASKAASDHLVRAWEHTFGLPTLITNCSNNYGPWQFPEKLIPVVINNALLGKKIPVYGKGLNVRDWLYVEDHVRALLTVVNRGRVGQTYNVGGHGERNNMQIVNTICAMLDELKPNPQIGKYSSLISYVEDRAGHDFRYAIDPNKIESELGWRAQETFESGMFKTVKWYLDNFEWSKRMMERVSK